MKNENSCYAWALRVILILTIYKYSIILLSVFTSSKYKYLFENRESKKGASILVWR